MAISIYDPRTMLEAVRQMHPFRTFLKDTFFGHAVSVTTDYVDVDYYKGRRRMAPFVAPKLAGKMIEREGFHTKTYKAPMLKPKRILTADDLMKRSMGEHIYSGRTPDQRAMEHLAQDLADLDEAITRREEWMVAQVLFTGKVEMVGEGVKETLDFQFTNKTEISQADKKWTSAKSDPIADLQSWRQAIIKDSGITPDMVIIASDVVHAFINHPSVQKILDNKRIELGKIEPRLLPNGVTYIGSIPLLGMDIYSYDEWYVDEVDDQIKSLVPSGTVLVASTRAKSSFMYGAVTLQAGESFHTFEGSRIPKTWMKEDPDARHIQIYSRPVPVPHEVNSWYVAKVL